MGGGEVMSMHVFIQKMYYDTDTKVSHNISDDFIPDQSRLQYNSMHY